MKTQYFFCNVKSINEQQKTLDVIASTAAIDRDGESILPSAYAKGLASFKANPVILACHQHRLQTGSSPVIGSAVPESIAITERDLGFTMRFADTPLGNEYWSLYRDKHMRAFSVGFIPGEFQDARVDGKTVRQYTAVELLEVSAVPVPSNPQALARAMSFYDETGDPAETIKSIQGPILAAIDEIKKTLSAFASLREEVADDLSEIKTLIAGPGGYGRELLGSSPDAAPHAGEKATAEAALTRISTLFKGS
jgi:HK97 family phage prohead protease